VFVGKLQLSVSLVFNPKMPLLYFYLVGIKIAMMAVGLRLPMKYSVTNMHRQI